MTNAVISRSEIEAAAHAIEPLPAALSRLLQLLADDHFKITELVEILSHDATLAGDVLNRANSSASGATRHIGDLRQAAARVGTREIVTIATRRAMRSRFAVALPAYGLDASTLWEHAITASVAAEVVRRESSTMIPPMIGTTALIHDVGKLVIGKCIPSSSLNLLVEAAEREGITLYEAERIVLGLDHAEVSGVVARSWKLPVSVQVALTQHHDPDTNDPFTHALVLSDELAHCASAFSHDRASGLIDPYADTAEAMADYTPSVDAQLKICGVSSRALPAMVIQIARDTSRILVDYKR